ncbi:DUF5131 family protein [Desulfosporosinus meridiei]|uniref:DUF5131 family protein n=1 Tax=Desulfosporosinus meridiei TaxID=79209 RepID=UPI00030BC241|nr:DUF5131 family protein [Desulfosporosinus meridiei]
MNPEWVLSIKNDCDYQGVSFYFKQWGGINKKKNGSIIVGEDLGCYAGNRG